MFVGYHVNMKSRIPMHTISRNFNGIWFFLGIGQGGNRRFKICSAVAEAFNHTRLDGYVTSNNYYKVKELEEGIQSSIIRKIGIREHLFKEFGDG